MFADCWLISRSSLLQHQITWCLNRMWLLHETNSWVLSIHIWNPFNRESVYMPSLWKWMIPIIHLISLTKTYLYGQIYLKPTKTAEFISLTSIFFPLVQVFLTRKLMLIKNRKAPIRKVWGFFYWLNIYLLSIWILTQMFRSRKNPSKKPTRMNVTGSKRAMMFTKKSGRLLFPFRSTRYFRPKEWNLWGGTVRTDESPEQSVIRNTRNNQVIQKNFQMWYKFIPLRQNELILDITIISSWLKMNLFQK